MNPQNLDKLFGAPLPVHPNELPERSYVYFYIAGGLLIAGITVAVIVYQKNMLQQNIRSEKTLKLQQ